MMSLVRLNIKGISYSQTQSGAYALILSEENGERKLPIVIGAFEAQSIAIALEKDIRPPRPLTHDLFKNFSDRYDITVKQVIIHKLVDGVFYASLICERDAIEEIIDARTSDAIALAPRSLVAQTSRARTPADLSIARFDTGVEVSMALMTVAKNAPTPAVRAFADALAQSRRPTT
jgi:bifunctional DNase/RNase